MRARIRRVRLALSTVVPADTTNRTATNGKLSNLLRIGQRRMRLPSLVGVRPQARVIGGIRALLSYDPALNSRARHVSTVKMPANMGNAKLKPHDVLRHTGLCGLLGEP
jgi:hypothetical protein